MIRRNRNLIKYELIILTGYLIWVIHDRALRVALPVYTVAAIFPLVFPRIKLPKTADIFSLLFIFLTSFYAVYGVCFQDLFEAVTTYVSRILQFVLFLLLIRRPEHEAPKNITSLVKLSACLESVVCIILLLSSMWDYTNRLVAGAQPVGGNIGIVMLPFLIYAFYREPDKRGSIITCYIIFLFWAVLSGTRGYVLMLGLSGLYPAIEFIKEGKGSRARFFYRIVLLTGFFAAIVIVMSTGAYEKLLDILRVSEGTGVRDYENQVLKGFFSSTDLLHKVLGIGYGGSPATIQGYSEAFLRVMYEWGGWGRSHYLYRHGSIFHNYYSNIILVSGICGILLTIGMFFWGLKRIRKDTHLHVGMRKSLVLFWVSFFVMLYFRWSCSCGIGEMIILSEVLLMNRFDETSALSHSGKCV
jgi:hypothetical protein